MLLSESAVLVFFVFAHCLNLVMVALLVNENADIDIKLSNFNLLSDTLSIQGCNGKWSTLSNRNVPTCWNSIYTMIKSNLSQYDDEHDLLSKRKELKLLYAIDNDNLSCCHFFWTFQECNRNVLRGQSFNSSFCGTYIPPSFTSSLYQRGRGHWSG